MEFPRAEAGLGEGMELPRTEAGLGGGMEFLRAATGLGEGVELPMLFRFLASSKYKVYGVSPPVVFQSPNFGMCPPWPYIYHC